MREQISSELNGLSGRRSGSQRDVIAQRVFAAHEPLLDGLPIPFIEGIASQFLIVLVLRQELVDNRQESMPDRNGGLLPPTPDDQSLKLGSEVGILVVLPKLLSS